MIKNAENIQKCTYSEFGTSMLLAMKPQFTRITTITNKLNNVRSVKEICSHVNYCKPRHT